MSGALKRDEWETVRLGDVATLINGRAYHQSELLDTGRYPVLRVGNFFSNNSWYYSDLELDPEKYCDNGDLLYAWSASFGAKIWDGGKVIFHYHIWKILLSEKVFRNYLYHYLTHQSKRLKDEGHGCSMLHLTKVGMENHLLPLPPLDVQRRIADTLDKVTELITLRKTQLEKLDELVKARFVELFGDPVVNSMAWAEELIGDSCFVTKLAGFEYTQYIHYEDSGDVVMVKAQNVKNGKLNRKDLSFISNEVSDSLPRSQLAVGDVVMTYVGANIGDVAVIDGEYKYHLAPNVAKIRPNTEKYNSIYFMYMLMFLNSYIVGNSADTAKAALGMERIRKLKVFVPPIELQNQFASFVKQINKAKAPIQQSLDTLETLKKSLMQEYFG